MNKIIKDLELAVNVCHDYIVHDSLEKIVIDLKDFQNNLCVMCSSSKTDNIREYRVVDAMTNNVETKTYLDFQNDPSISDRIKDQIRKLPAGHSLELHKSEVYIIRIN